MKSKVMQMPLFLRQISTVFSTLVAQRENTSTASNQSSLSKANLQKLQEEGGASGRFACEIVFAYYPELEDSFSIYGIRIVSTVVDLASKCSPEADIFNPLVGEDEKIKKLQNGIWMAYIQGKVWWETNINYEFGTDDGDWIFEPDESYPQYIPLSVVTKEIKHEPR